MKKLTCLQVGKILSIIVLTFFILLVPFLFHKVSAQDKKTLTCEEYLNIVGEGECKHFAVNYEKKILWCAPTIDGIIGDQSSTKTRPPDYYLSADSPCGENPDQDVTTTSLLIDQAGQQTQKKTSKSNPLNIFGINPFETWLNLNAFAEAGAFINSGIAERFAESTVLHMTGNEPIWEKEAREVEEAKKFFGEATSRLAELESKGGEADPSLTSARNRVETTKLNLLLKGGGALVELQPMDGQNGVLEKGQPPILKSGAVDVIVEPQNGEKFEIQTPNTEIFVIGTEFSVIYDQKKGETWVAVYKGKVEVKAKDQKITQVSPDGDKPGIVVVAQKFSATKLVLASVVLVVVIGGVVFFLKRRFAKTLVSKRKTSR